MGRREYVRMLTPHDIEVKTFDKAFSGYKAVEVDEFLNEINKDYEQLYKENNVLKEKLAVLVQKIEEYKEMEASLRNALVSAQKMGESMLKEANTRSEYIISEANSKAERIMHDINMQIMKEKQALDGAKRETQLFKAKVIALLRSEIEMMESIPQYVIAESDEETEVGSKVSDHNVKTYSEPEREEDIQDKAVVNDTRGYEDEEQPYTEEEELNIMNMYKGVKPSDIIDEEEFDYSFLRNDRREDAGLDGLPRISDD